MKLKHQRDEISVAYAKTVVDTERKVKENERARGAREWGGNI